MIVHIKPLFSHLLADVLIYSLKIIGLECFLSLEEILISSISSWLGNPPTFLKNIIHPLIAFIISKYVFSLDELLVVTVTLASALPSGSQTYYFAFRYNTQKDLISSNIILSTFVSFFSLSILIILFNF